MTEKRKIIIDTDPGQDDAVAILLALANPQHIDILGLTAVAGNVPLDLTSKNVRIILEVAGRSDIPVFEGCDKPISRSLITAEHVHGKSGLDGPVLFEPSTPIEEQGAVDFIIETLRHEPENTVTLCTLGPLTNIATAFSRAPDIAARAKELVMMGGGYFEGGNITPAAEFNIYVDPEAANIVMQSGVPIVMMPLDVTHKVLTLKARVEKIAALGTPISRFVVDMLEFFERFDVEKYGADGGPLHDPTVIAYLLKPELFAGRACNVEIETTSPLTLGMTVVDWWQVTKRPHNAMVMHDIDADGFFELLTESLARL